jgi:hypothetical protein
MKRLIVAALLVASCTPATTGGIVPASGTPGPAPASPASAAPQASANPDAPATPTTQPTTTPAALSWPRLADLPVTLPIAKARLYARSTKDVYAVVGTSDLWRYDGTRWNAIPVSGAGNLIALTGNAQTVWVSTDKGFIVKVSNTNAVSIMPAISSHPIPSLAITDPITETLLAACTDGNSLALIVQGTNVTPQLTVRKTGTVVATANGKQFAFATDGFAAYRNSDTATWSMKDAASSDPIRGAVAYTGGQSDLDVMAVGDRGASIRLAGGFFMPFGTTTARTPLNDVSAVNSSGIFAVGDSGLVLFFGSDAWRPIVSESSLGNILAISALGSREVIVLTSKGQVFAGPYIQYL